jgi:hypothetical protein
MGWQALWAQDAEPRTREAIETQLPIPSTEFTPPPPPKAVPAMQVEAATTRSLATHRITILRGEASTLPDIPPPPDPKPPVRGAPGEPRYVLSFGATVYDHRVSQVPTIRSGITLWLPRTANSRQEAGLSAGWTQALCLQQEDSTPRKSHERTKIFIRSLFDSICREHLFISGRVT